MAYGFSLKIIQAQIIAPKNLSNFVFVAPVFLGRQRAPTTRTKTRAMAQRDSAQSTARVGALCTRWNIFGWDFLMFSWDRTRRTGDGDMGDMETYRHIEIWRHVHICFECIHYIIVLLYTIEHNRMNAYVLSSVVVRFTRSLVRLLST